MMISIFGLGYVGAVSLACLARDGHQVIGVDIDSAKLAIAHGDTEPKAELPPSELAAYTLVANMILNLDETLTRN